MNINPKVVDIYHGDTVTDFSKAYSAGYRGGPFLCAALRRFDATELFGVFSGAVRQSAAYGVCGLRDLLMRMMNEFEAQVLSDLCVLKTQMTGLVGDGNSGRMTELERRIERHEQNLQRAKGFMAAMSVLMAVVEVAVEAWRRH